MTDVSRAQFGVVGAADLDRLGVPTSHVRNWTRSGRLERVAPGVWRTVGAPATWEQRVQTGLLQLGPDALVSHEAAARVHGFEHTPPEPVEFLVPWEQRNRRTCLEAAMDSAIRSRATSPVVLEQRLDALRGPGRWGCRAIEALLVDTGGESVLERRFLTLVRHAGLPRPSTQFRIAHGARTVARVDFAWEPFTVVVEVSGRLGHSTPSERAKDARRRNQIQDLGWRVYEYTWGDVTERPGHVARTLTERLTTAGWRR